MKFTPHRIALIYFLIAIVWVTTTDALVEYFFSDDYLTPQIYMFKGIFYVTATAYLLYVMVKTHEERLQEEQELKLSILENIPVMITIYTPELSEFSVNNEFEKVTGWSNRDISSVDVMDFVEKVFPDKQSKEKVLNFMELTDAGWKDFELATKSGDIIHSTWTNIQLSDDTKIGIGLDITERKRIEKQLKSNKEWLQLSTTSSNVGLWEWHPKTGETVFDEMWANLVGYSLEELQPVSIETWNELVHPEDLHKFQQEIDRYFSGETSIYECEVRMKHKDGHWVWILDRGRTVEWNEEGDPERLVGTHVDITYQKSIEKRINEERRRFEIASNLTSDVIWEWDPKSDELLWGDGIESVLGYKKSQYKDDPNFWENHIADYDRERVIQSRDKAKRSRANHWSDEYDFISADGSIRKIEDTAVILQNTDGTIQRMIGAMVDRTKEITYQDALHRQSHRFEMIAKSSNDVLFEWNLKTNQIWWSEGWKSQFNYSEDAVDSSPEWWKSKIHPEDKQRVLKDLDKNLDSNRNYWTAYYRFKNGNNDYSHVVNRGYFMKNEKGEKESLVGTISNITSDVLAKKELQACEEQYRLLFKQNPIPMFIYDPDTLKFTTVNQAALKKYKYTEKEMVQMSIRDIRPETEVENLENVLKNYSEKERVKFHEAIHQDKKGNRIIAEVSSSTILYKGKKQRLVIANDITEQRAAEKRAISAIIEGEERERKRISKELHDGLGQYLSASNMNLKAVYEDLDEIPESLDSTFERGLNFLNHAISEIRNISQNLLPKAIQDYGLELAAESLTNQLQKSHDVDFYFYSNLNGVELSDNLQINLYRILQEALNNAIRHAKPSKIDVQLVHTEGEILMTIEDNGTGFDTKSDEVPGLGIRSMKTRVGAMSANLDIVSNKERGTIISVVVPVN